ncbi:MAG: response regulator [Tunicatimonas sp.]
MIDLVMLIDDNETDNFISKRIIEITQFADQVEVKNSGEDALAYLVAHAADVSRLPRLIFLDINMPVMDGFMFLYEFENLAPTVQERCQVVILSSSDNQRDIDKIVNNQSVIQYITKPLTKPALEGINVNA